MNAGNFPPVLNQIAEDFGIQLKDVSALTGGDINEVFLLESRNDKFVVKLNDSARFPGMFEAEKSGLEELLASSVIDVPKPLKTGQATSQSYLILEYKSSAPKASDFWEKFGEQLAQLHQETSEKFGFKEDNYIGSLPQYNSQKKSTAEFFIEMRLKPQIEMAEENGFNLNVKTSFYRNCHDSIPSEPPSLIHGDLWNGNYLVNAQGNACLIDPAVSYAPREMDLGMMKLFGGFNETLFHTYNEIYPLQKDWEERIPLWQLYYLLVHLNIFGAGYRSQVTSILQKFS